MKIAIIGYGKMGHAIEDYVRQLGYEVTCIIDKGDEWPEKIDADVAVEFTTPQTAVENLRRCFERHIPVVCGTTGWYDRYDEVCDLCRKMDGSMLTATNFSLGMNIMFAVNEYLAGFMNSRIYNVGISETHHIHKLDAPSGTAITLQQQIVKYGHRNVEDVPITSYREGEVPGTHTVMYDSPIDAIYLTHEAHDRRGLAQGAVVATDWLAEAKPGVYTMKDVLNAK